MLNEGQTFKKLLGRVRYDVRSGEGSGDNAPVVLLADYVIEYAVRYRASDMHLEALEDRARLRYRIDGTLLERHEPFDLKVHAVLVSRLKIMAGMDTAERRRPLDGHIHHVYGGEAYDFRAATMPTKFGEAFVLRLMGGRGRLLGLDELGFSEANLKKLRQLIHAPAGMVAVAGPMNSGKTTTLYAALAEINRPERSIMTVEDPIEGFLPGISQVEVDRHDKVRLDFAAGLRAILRMDVNSIMVGEIRDEETAQIAIRAALTGHLLLTTIHAKDSVSSFFRLLEMGAAPHLLCATLSGLVSQRLVRRLCPHCKEIYEPTEQDKLLLGDLYEPTQKMYRSVGCEKCFGTGYSGQIAVQEVLAFDEELRRLAMAGADIDSFRGLVQEAGFVDMWADGVAKVYAGVTDLAEVRRVLYGDG